MNDQYGLMPEEIELFEAWKKAHTSECDAEKVNTAIEEDCAPTLFVVELCFSSIGMYPIAKCLVCGKRESIACQERIESV